MMDSTFMGTMAGVALRLKELGHGHLHVVHCGVRSRELLSGLGLDQIFSIHIEWFGGAATARSSDHRPDPARADKEAEQAQDDAGRP